MSAPALRLAGVHVRLGGRAVFAGLDLAIAPQRLTVVVGPNGAGKTTLLRTFAGLLVAERGAASVGERPLAAMSPGERARTLAYLPQGAAIAWPMPVADVVGLGRLPHGERPQALPAAGQKAVADALEAVGMADFAHRAATALSGGERARVLLARALATQAPVLLADEPVAALDPRWQLLALERLRARARAGGTAVVVMHDLALAARFADDVVLLDAGRIVAAGAPGTVFTAARLAEVFGIEATITQSESGLVVQPARALSGGT